MNLVALKATDRKFITLTIDYDIQRYQCIARCRHNSIHVINTRHDSARTRLYNDKSFQSRLRHSKICQVVNRGYIKRDHLIRLCQSIHKTKMKSEIFGISTWVHAMSIIYRGTDICRRCRHTSLHITYTRNTSQWWFPTTKVHKHTSAVQESKICHVISGGYMKRDHLTRRADSIIALTKQNEGQDIWNKHIRCMCWDVTCNV